MENEPAPTSRVPSVTALRTPASGACRCSRRSCWHQGACRASAVVRVLRAVDDPETDATSVTLCRECAAPTRRNRVA
ncbi:MAG TPA: hypothetical protein VLS91_05770 [Acidimicrobiales bacterium]|nr:hypothetical protein [Acidimicrobiales bacterium]